MTSSKFWCITRVENGRTLHGMFFDLFCVVMSWDCGPGTVCTAVTTGGIDHVITWNILNPRTERSPVCQLWCLLSRQFHRVLMMTLTSISTFRRSTTFSQWNSVMVYKIFVFIQNKVGIIMFGINITFIFAISDCRHSVTLTDPRYIIW